MTELSRRQSPGSCGPRSTLATRHFRLPTHRHFLSDNAVTIKIPERPEGPSRLPQRGGISAEGVADLELVAAHARVVDFQRLAGWTAGQADDPQ